MTANWPVIGQNRAGNAGHPLGHDVGTYPVESDADEYFDAL